MAATQMAKFKSREYLDLVKSIGECKSKNEEDAIMKNEVSCEVLKCFSNTHSLTLKRLPHHVVPPSRFKGTSTLFVLHLETDLLATYVGWPASFCANFFSTQKAIPTFTFTQTRFVSFC